MSQSTSIPRYFIHFLNADNIFVDKIEFGPSINYKEVKRIAENMTLGNHYCGYIIGFTQNIEQTIKTYKSDGSYNTKTIKGNGSIA